MKTIRQKISRPYLVIILLIPITIICLFNLIVSFSNRAKAEEDLRDAVVAISQNMNDDNMKNFMTFVRSQRNTTSAELLAFNKNGAISRLFEQSDSFITEDLAEIVYEEIQTLDYNDIGSFSYQGDTYYVVLVDYQSKSLNGKIVYVSKGLVIDEFVDTVNLVLIIVSVLITLIALFVSNRVTNSVAKPIEEITALVENMKSDEMIRMPDHSDSIEMSKLIGEINALNKRIYDYNQSQKNFLHNASHELRTPLMSIQGYADGIELGVFSDAKGTAHLISEQSKRLTKLVDELLSLARAENFHANKKLERLNISDYLLELTNGYRGYAISRNIDLKLEIKPDIFAISSSELLAYSIGNILSNAIRYGKSTVEISLEARGDKTVITIKDDGVGIEHPDAMFQRFAKGTDGNFGLGLSIAKTSVEMMNGTIRVFNQDGAVFVVEL